MNCQKTTSSRRMPSPRTRCALSATRPGGRLGLGETAFQVFKYFSHVSFVDRISIRVNLTVLPLGAEDRRLEDAAVR